MCCRKGIHCFRFRAGSGRKYYCDLYVAIKCSWIVSSQKLAGRGAGEGIVCLVCIMPTQSSHTLSHPSDSEDFVIERAVEPLVCLVNVPGPGSPNPQTLIRVAVPLLFFESTKIADFDTGTGVRQFTGRSRVAGRGLDRFFRNLLARVSIVVNTQYRLQQKDVPSASFCLSLFWVLSSRCPRAPCSSG